MQCFLPEILLFYYCDRIKGYGRMDYIKRQKPFLFNQFNEKTFYIAIIKTKLSNHKSLLSYIQQNYSFFLYEVISKTSKWIQRINTWNTPVGRYFGKWHELSIKLIKKLLQKKIEKGGKSKKSAIVIISYNLLFLVIQTSINTKQVY